MCRLLKPLQVVCLDAHPIRGPAAQVLPAQCCVVASVDCMQLPQASKQPPPRQGKSKRARAEDGSDGEDSDAGEGDAEADEEAAEGQAGSGAEDNVDAAGEGGEGDNGAAGDEEKAAAELRRKRALRQSQGTGFVAFIPAQLSAVSAPMCTV